MSVEIFLDDSIPEIRVTWIDGGQRDLTFQEYLNLDDDEVAHTYAQFLTVSERMAIARERRRAA